MLFVLLDPGLDGSDAALKSLGDGDGIQALGGKDDGLMAFPEPLGRDRLGQLLEFFQGQMIVDMHRQAPGVGRSLR